MKRWMGIVFLVVAGSAAAQSPDSFAQRTDPSDTSLGELRRREVGPIRAEQDCPSPAGGEVWTSRGWNNLELGVSIPERSGKPGFYTRYTCPKPPSRKD